MKAFGASLLATCALAANKVTWTGTAVTAGDLKATPSGSSSWDGTADKMVVTYKTSVTLSNVMASGDLVQAWWCLPANGKTDCNIWQWEATSATNFTIKGKNYTKSTTTLDTNIPAKDPKAYFGTSSKGWTAESAYWYKQTGNNKTPAKDTGETQKTGNYAYVSSKVNSKTLSGTMKRTYDSATTDSVEASGLSAKGLIGVYAKDKSKDKKEGKITTGKSLGIAKKPVAKVVTVNGQKKTWTGPKISHESNEATAGGWTLWTKVGTDLDSWLC